MSVPSTIGYSYAWLLNGNSITNQNTNTYTANAGGVYTCNITSPAGCSAISKPLTVVDSTPVASISPSGSAIVCSGSALKLQAGTAMNWKYAWYKNSLLLSDTTASITISDSGNYQVRVSNGTCTSLSAITAISRFTPAAVNLSAGGATTFCSGNSVVLSSTTLGSGSISWYNGATKMSDTSRNVTIASSGSYSISFLDSKGCTTNSNTISIIVNSLPSASINPSGTVPICSNATAALSANTGNNLKYTWIFNGTQTLPDTTANVSYNTPGSYTVKVTNASGCSVTSTASQITYISCIQIDSLSYNRLYVCRNDSIKFRFRAANFTTSNTYTIQLSNGSGSFSSPITLGTITGQNGYFNFTYTIPSTLPIGTNYQMRVLSSSPVVTSAPIPSFTVLTLPSTTFQIVTPSANQTICSGQSVNLSVPYQSDLKYQWFINNVLSTSDTLSTVAAKTAGVYPEIRTGSPANGGCQTRRTAQTDSDQDHGCGKSRGGRK
jgi:hypothetical protein